MLQDQITSRNSQEAVQQKLKDFQEKNDYLDRRVKQLLSENNRLAAHSVDANSKLQVLESKYEDLNRICLQMASSSQILENRLNELDHKKISLETFIGKMRNEAKGLAEQVTNFEISNVKFQDQLTLKGKELAQIREDFQKLEAEKQKQDKNVDRLRKSEGDF
jgi:chromosome segregation ATPase